MEDGTLDVDKQVIEFFDIRYGNFCNLKCRMCGPTDSHMWYPDFIKLTDGKEYSFIPNRIRIGKGKKKFALLKIKNNHDKVWQPKDLLFKINKEGEGEVEISIPIKILY